MLIILIESNEETKNDIGKDNDKVLEIAIPYDVADGKEISIFRYHEDANGWRDEGVAWYAAEYVGRLVYKITNPKTGKVFYTISKAEKEALEAAGFTCETAEFSAY